MDKGMLERKATILPNQHMHAPHLHTHSYPRGRTDGLVYRLKLKSKHGQTVWISQIKTRKVTFFFSSLSVHACHATAPSCAPGPASQSPAAIIPCTAHDVISSTVAVTSVSLTLARGVWTCLARHQPSAIPVLPLLHEFLKFPFSYRVP